MYLQPYMFHFITETHIRTHN